MGCGKHVEPGWINADGDPSAPTHIVLAVGDPLPFLDGSLEVVFSEHFLEHLSFDQACWFMREAHRTLIRGGLFRVSCPDLAFIARVICTGDESWRQLAMLYETIGDHRVGVLTSSNGGGAESTVNWAFYGHCHKHLWTYDQLVRELRRAGFAGDVRRCQFGESSVPGAAIEIRQQEAFYSLIAETTKK
ncbi:MAG: methyltransferase domain-containing protein [Gemmatimonadota bacterium]|nr:methyltransferase domain-containing protein [Gemmatimonadota bacterium]